MALTKNGRYARIAENRSLALVQVDIYASESSRRNGVGEFESVYRVGVALPDGIYEGMADPSKSVMNNILTSQYVALKNDQQFQGWEDC